MANYCFRFPNPEAKGAHVPLVRLFWLSTKANNKAWIEPVVDTDIKYALHAALYDPLPVIIDPA